MNFIQILSEMHALYAIIHCVIANPNSCGRERYNVPAHAHPLANTLRIPFITLQNSFLAAKIFFRTPRALLLPMLLLLLLLLLYKNLGETTRVPKPRSRLNLLI